MAGVEQPASPAHGFDALVEAHWDSVYRFMLQRSGHTHDADELTQEAFLRALQGWHTFVPGSNARAWLMRIACNLFLDQVRQGQRRKVQTLEGDFSTSQPTLGRDLELADDVRVVQATLRMLPETTRLVFHLRAVEGLAYRDIAELAGVSEEAARWHMRQARLRLLERLGEGIEEERT